MFLTENIFAEDTKQVSYDWGQFGCYDLKYKYKNEHTSEVLTYKLPNHELDNYLENLYNNKQTNINKKYITK